MYNINLNLNSSEIDEILMGLTLYKDNIAELQTRILTEANNQIVAQQNLMNENKIEGEN